ncbi:MAG: hypothetical protein K6G58_07125 [Lachnospiraceae bacterium]|nr:hypothetical protein [Lachnospiraceae bacterium]
MNVNIFSFSGVYNDQDFWRIPGDGIRFFDLTDIGGTNGYLSDEARNAIRERIAASPVDAVNFIDSGNTHYMTDILCRRNGVPFALVLIDNHTDMQAPAFGGLESCGSWVRFALEMNPMLTGVLIIGPGEASAREAWGEDVKPYEDGGAADADVMPVSDTICVKYNGKPVVLLPEEYADKDRVSGCMDMLSGSCSVSGAGPEGIYLSIDKDILSRDELVTNWDQGNMSPEVLAGILGGICDKAGKKLLGVDICGECPPQAQYSGDLRAYGADLEQNNEINAKLLDIFAGCR